MIHSGHNIFHRDAGFIADLGANIIHHRLHRRCQVIFDDDHRVFSIGNGNGHGIDIIQKAVSHAGGAIAVAGKGHRIFRGDIGLGKANLQSGRCLRSFCGCSAFALAGASAQAHQQRKYQRKRNHLLHEIASLLSAFIIANPLCKSRKTNRHEQPHVRLSQRRGNAGSHPLAISIPLLTQKCLADNLQGIFY